MAYFDKLTGNRVYPGTRSWLNASASLTRFLMSPVFVSNICFISIGSECSNAVMLIYDQSAYILLLAVRVLGLLFNTAMYM